MKKLPEKLQKIAEAYSAFAKARNFGTYQIGIPDDIDDEGVYEIYMVEKRSMWSSAETPMFGIQEVGLLRDELVQSGIPSRQIPQGKPDASGRMIVSCFILEAYVQSGYSRHSPPETLEKRIATVPYRDRDRTFYKILEHWILSLMGEELSGLAESLAEEEELIG